jgi:hypothetical protein
MRFFHERRHTLRVPESNAVVSRFAAWRGLRWPCCVTTTLDRSALPSSMERDGQEQSTVPGNAENPVTHGVSASQDGRSGTRPPPGFTAFFATIACPRCNWRCSNARYGAVRGGRRRRPTAGSADLTLQRPHPRGPACGALVGGVPEPTAVRCPLNVHAVYASTCLRVYKSGIGKPPMPTRTHERGACGVELACCWRQQHAAGCGTGFGPFRIATKSPR